MSLRVEVVVRQHASLMTGDRKPLAAKIQGSDLGTIERGTIERIARQTGRNKSKAARHLGLTRTQLYGRLRRYGLDVPPVDVALA